jgi:16S rRNA processing protein RimM
MSVDDDYIVVGKIGSTYGVKGWLKIISFTQPLAGILGYPLWHIEDGHGWKPVKPQAGREHGKGLVVHLPGLDNPEVARLQTGKKIAIQRAQLPSIAENEYFWTDLEGLTVINHDDQVLGTVIYLMETGSNDVLVVKGEKEHAIPYLLDDVILSIDLTKKEMRVRWEII